MTDRFNALTVVLEKDMRDDDAKALIDAIKQLRGVSAVSGHSVDISAYVAEQRVRADLASRLLDVLNPKKDKA